MLSRSFWKPEKIMSSITARLRILTLLKLSKRASIMRNIRQPRNPITPIVIPNPQAFESLSMGHVPFWYMSSDAIDANTIIENTFKKNNLWTDFILKINSINFQPTMPTIRRITWGFLMNPMGSKGAPAMPPPYAPSFRDIVVLLTIDSKNSIIVPMFIFLSIKKSYLIKFLFSSFDSKLA